jgi:hypothetical protein
VKVIRWGSTLVEDEVLYGNLTTVSGALARGAIVTAGNDGEIRGWRERGMVGIFCAV